MLKQPRQRKLVGLRKQTAASKGKHRKPKAEVSEHHKLKLLRKVIKKAKQFEVRKVSRRIKTLQDGKGEAASPNASTQHPPGQQNAAGQKLRCQLEALKQLDIDELTKHAAMQLGVLPAKPAADSQVSSHVSLQPDANAPSDTIASARNLVAARVLSAHCVREQVASLLAAAKLGAERAERAVQHSHQAAAPEAPGMAASAAAEGVGRPAGTATAADTGQVARSLPGSVDGGGAAPARKRKRVSEQDSLEPEGHLSADALSASDASDGDVTYTSDEDGIPQSPAAADADHADADGVGSERPGSPMHAAAHLQGLPSRGRALPQKAGEAQLQQEPGTAKATQYAKGTHSSSQHGAGAGADTAPTAAAIGKQHKNSAAKPGSASTGAKSAKAAKLPKKPPKKKNRLGQRARKQLAMQKGLPPSRVPSRGHPQQRGAGQQSAWQPRKPLPGGPRAAIHAAAGQLPHARQQAVRSAPAQGKDRLPSSRSSDQQRQGAKGVPPQAISERLHPSWEAKRRQAPLMAQPQGTKIVFDEPGGGAMKPALAKKPGMSKKPAEALHPSWEAKKRQAATVVKPQGTKIVFDD